MSQKKHGQEGKKKECTDKIESLTACKISALFRKHKLGFYKEFIAKSDLLELIDKQFPCLLKDKEGYDCFDQCMKTTCVNCKNREQLKRSLK